VTAALLANVLEEVVLEKDLRDLRLIGNSVGGFAAARLAIRHPDRVAGLVLVDNGGFGANNPITRTFCRVMGRPAIAKLIMPRFVKSYMQPKTASDHAIVERTVAGPHPPGNGSGRVAVAQLRPPRARPARAGRQAHRSHPDPVGQEGQGAPAQRRTRDPQAPAALEDGDPGHRARRLSAEPEACLRVVEPFLASLPADPSVDHR
jgi:pimeloyl-ACP methyl ester carboxylesterase